MHERLHREYFSEGTRGHGFIKNFYLKNRSQLTRLDYSDFNDFLNQVFLGLSSTGNSKIEGPEENYIIKSIYYQCWNLLFKQKELASRRSFDPVAGGHEASGPASVEPDPQLIMEETDLFEQIVLFKASLKPLDRRILNGLIDDRKLTELSKEIKISYTNLNVRIKRLRERLAAHLAALGFNSQTISHFLKTEKTL